MADLLSSDSTLVSYSNGNSSSALGVQPVERAIVYTEYEVM
ncbi:hypothetical protein CCP3SC15_170029 [Gammaproteobacteria bacterium]